ncbi:hypothetical protein [Neptuniibacter marinus]|jgi:hypothetical protein|tara:strand:- start:1037 stop:1180 length:144 start_codon:yes stop_codon:yes gene_type:complete
MKHLMVEILSVALVGTGLRAYANQKEAGMQNGETCDRPQMMRQMMEH